MKHSYRWKDDKKLRIDEKLNETLKEELVFDDIINEE